jgi:hypothetical protein
MRPPQSRAEIHDRLAPAHEARTSFEWNPDHLGDDHHRQRTGEVGDEIHFASWDMLVEEVVRQLAYTRCRAESPPASSRA